jgi:PST family polysaccharide transporter
MRDFVRGINWSIFQQIINILLNYVTIIIFAKLLSPADFGLVAISSVIIGLFETLNGFGIPQLLIQKNIKENNEIGKYITTCIVLSLILSLICIFVSKLYSLWFDLDYKEKLFNILLVSTSSLIFSSINSIYQAQYQRDLDFKKLSIFSIITIFLGNVSAIVYAKYQSDYWAIIFKNLAPLVFLTIGYLIFSQYKLNFTFKNLLNKSDYKFTLWFSWNQIINYLARNLDYLIIGKYFDLGIVGQYNIAYRLMLFPMKLLSSKVQAVLYPVLAIMANKPNQLIAIYIRVVSFISFIVLPLMALLSVTSSVWISWFFDIEKYDILIPLIQILIIAGAFQAITSPIGTLYLVFDLMKLMTIYSLISTFIFCIGFLIGGWSRNIFVFASIYVVLSLIINFFASNIVPLRKVNYSISDFFLKTLEPLFPTILSVSIVCIYLYNNSIFINISNNVIILFVSIVIYIPSYIVSYFLVYRNSFKEKLKIIFNVFQYSLK